VTSAAYLILLGCASPQLNYNTLDLAGSVDDLLSSQVVYNLVRFLNDPSGNAAQVSIGSGSVSTTNQASLSLVTPLTTAVTTTNAAATAAGAVLPAITRSTSGLAGAFSLTPSATNQATQNWALTTDTDSDQERRLRALYRYATGWTDWHNLCEEYALISTNPVVIGGMTAPTTWKTWITPTALDGQFLREPGCIICSETANRYNISSRRPHSDRKCSKELYVNPRLTHHWLAPMRGEFALSQTDGLFYIGHYNGWTLYTKSPEDYHQFILFVLEAANISSTAGQSGKNAPPKSGTMGGAAPAQPSFVLPAQ
jgi:hypothetical protein